MIVELSPADARRMRLRAHLLDGSALDPAQVVQRAVALQGQDLPAVLRAIAIRSRPGTSVQNVRAAFDRGELVRSWPMRGTLFATTPSHLAALLHFTADRLHRAASRRREQLGLDGTVVERARAVLQQSLAERSLLRSEALSLWQSAGIPTEAGRGYHLLAHFAIGGVMHWGPFDETGTEQRLTLSAAAAPEDPDAALAEVVRGYVAARGPVTEADLAWWTKLPRAVLRRAAASVDDLERVRIDGADAWVVGAQEVPQARGVTLVPAFDEWILGYGDRSLVASPRMLDALVPGNNGVFRPAVLVDGVVVGTWRQPRSKPVEVELVETVDAATRDEIDRAAEAWPHGV
ncbi:winged helix DNA-binding domain-containing protein [Salinibacterium sp. SYSU T00001]|uniref:winged helix DNA-binding domain-containing protein n=1 Tax=Homoserinimonas sedimenticola TaxID=2986805 RepID=UPI0022362133|nr:winged helix DNA-binding domain-containing protein [Salinibacterium sedimenticola]MCW4384197.1 winged helix DNA-binding domain-containing protein [Salinibacterium sedimenticola]